MPITAPARRRGDGVTKGAGTGNGVRFLGHGLAVSLGRARRRHAGPPSPAPHHMWWGAGRSPTVSTPQRVSAGHRRPSTTIPTAPSAALPRIPPGTCRVGAISLKNNTYEAHGAMPARRRTGRGAAPRRVPVGAIRDGDETAPERGFAPLARRFGDGGAADPHPATAIVVRISRRALLLQPVIERILNET